MRTIRIILVFAIFIGLQGCASVTKGTKDTIQVQVSNCSEPMDCTATNKKGSWPFTAPGPVTFKKSDNDLTISCRDGNEVITRSLRPTRGGMIWGNVLIGGIIGGGLDAITDAHWNMADSLILHRNNCGQNNQMLSSQKVQPTVQRVRPSTAQSVQPSSQKARPTVQSVQPSNQRAPPTVQSVQPSSQNALPTVQSVQPPSQKPSSNQAKSKPTYITNPPLGWLSAVNERDKDDCEFITSITKNVGGTGEVSTFVRSAKNSALTEAMSYGANSYFIVNAESNVFGASVTLEALKCK